MQATIGCLSRIVSRTLVNNVVTNQQQQQQLSTSSCVHQRSSSPAPPAKREELKDDASEPQDHARLVTAVSGFPKSSNAYNIDHILKGQIGDDAYFIASHLDDWNSSSTITRSETCPPPLSSPSSSPSSSSSLRSSPQPVPSSGRQHRSRRMRQTSLTSSDESSSPPSVEQLLNPMATASLGASPTLGGLQREDVPLGRIRHPSNNSADVIGVADGVGGWRQYGVDPGQFSMQLMQSCERLVKAGYFVSDQPARLLAQGFSEMQAQKRPVIGSSTACLAMLSHADGKLYTANIGDSGLVVVRNGRVVHRSTEQQHYFNTPYQLSLPPTEMASDVLSDRPEAADRYEFNVQDGDIIILATDGVFDNVDDDLLVEQLETLKGFTNDQSKIQACANSIALMARTLSRDEYFLSPFAKNARASGFDQVLGGKEDDVTVVLAAVSCKTPLRQNGL